ncbi:DinB family protein [Bacillus cereus group sp. Bc222]|uniref:DinB family protein n=1 Tax=unclassified Bacillus cereus group TaxID=2750818 RepID=UPI000945CFF5|nr:MULTISPECIES: DinB family protein [unclassified Bacillus cereus group]MDA2239408.1 DinB family protein [Bacillus cereus group sp. Bc222]MDA2586458.1 DinB family protein [Bacillus cereus group sp. Bc062]
MNFVIDKIDSFHPEFSKLVSMMNYARYTTMQAVEDLTMEELDYLYNDEANSIGMLLYHMAAVEFYYQIHTFEDREPTEAELERWLPGLELEALGREEIKGKSIEFYIDTLQEVRSKTIETFQSLPDEWLFKTTDFWYDKQANNYFKWFHVFEDEINHRGQIRLIKKMQKAHSIK